MSSFLCFLCHSTVNADTNEEIREKYREVVGMNLCPDSHLCYICCHVLNKLWLFRSICLKRSLEYPVLFSEKGTINLQLTDTEVQILCTEELCEQRQSRLNNYNTYHFNDCSSDINNDYIENNGYVEFDRHYFDQNNVNDKVAESCNVTELQDIQGNLPNENVDGIVESTDNIVNTYNDYNLEHDVLETNISDDVTENFDDVNDVDVNEDFVNDIDDTIGKEDDGFIKIIKTLEEQKAELETNRKKKKYLEAEFKCYNCALGFLLKDTYQAHMMRHEESNGEYQCIVCTLRFGSSSGLRHHRSLHAARFVSGCGRALRRGAQGARPSCDTCGKQFADKSSLSRHWKRIHGPPSNKTFTCSVCGQMFDNQAALKSHMIKHINRKFRCPHCPSQFSSPYSLRAHELRHGAAPEMHPCEVCGLVYRSRKGLRDHYARAAVHQHTRYECNICGRSYTKEGLATHIRRVHEERPRKRPPALNRTAVCHKCGASFNNNSKLNRHLKIVCEKEQNDDIVNNDTWLSG